MSTIFLRFNSQEEFVSSVSSLSAIDPELLESNEFQIGDISFSVIGSIEGTSGWHVNATALPTGWEQYAVTVQTPLRIFLVKEQPIEA